MAKNILLPALALAAILAFSCKDKQPQQSVSAVAVESSIPETADAASGIPGFALRVGTSFYTLESDTGAESDKTKWTAAMSLGEKVFIGKDRRLTFSGDGKVHDFVEVRREDGKDGFSFATHVAANASLAVVVDEKANLYRGAKDVDVTGNIIPRRTIVAYFPDSETNGFVEIKAYDPVAELSRRGFLGIGSLSRRESDIQASILLQTALPLKNEGNDKNRKEALLETAMKKYSDSVFNTEISDLLYPNTAVAIKTEATERGSMSVNDDNVDVRDLPDSVAGKITGHLNKYDTVTVVEQTANTSTVGGHNARWYRITEPREGWVFGAFLDDK
ncbi:MAG: SH3 domain-containing protein [Treponema sp.]|jgi:hypothetical protein|nr:SH3 domain-containing protein [Treponema sp.]